MADPQRVESEKQPERPTPDTWGRQIVGALIGAAVAWVLTMWARQAGWIEGNPVRYVMWGAVIGGLVGAIENLEAAGRKLTRRDVRWLNALVGVLGMAVVSAVIYGLSFVIGFLVRLVMGS